MKKLILGSIIIVLSGCGYVSKGNEAIGQVKVVVHSTPLLCPEFDGASVSLGVVTNGSGSFSHQDIDVTLTNETVLNTFKDAASTGKLVKFKYDKKRFGGNNVICTPVRFITHAEIVN